MPEPIPKHLARRVKAAQRDQLTGLISDEQLAQFWAIFDRARHWANSWEIRPHRVEATCQGSATPRVSCVRGLATTIRWKNLTWLVVREPRRVNMTGDAGRIMVLVNVPTDSPVHQRLDCNRTRRLPVNMHNQIIFADVRL